MMSRKPLQPSFAIDDASMNNTAIESMDSVNSSASIMQIHSSYNPNASIATATNLNNLSDYSVQINQLNDLIDDDNGDCLDMSFWESFDNNFTYENDLLTTNSSQTPQQQQQSYDAKSGVKRSMSQINEASSQHSSADRKRKRGNVSPAIKSNIRERLKNSPNSQEKAISMIAAEIAHSSATFDAKPATTATIPNGSIFRDQMHNSGSVQPRAEDKRDATILKKKTTTNIKKNESVVTTHEKKQKSPTSPDLGRLVGRADDSTILNPDVPPNPSVAISRVNVKTQEAMVPMKTQDINEDNESSIPLTAEAPQPLQTMILSSSDDIVQSTDLKTITKILSENDHRTPTQTTAGDSKTQTITAVPIDENENYLLDIVYKCLRGKDDRTNNSNCTNGGVTNTGATINGNSSSTSSGSVASSHRNAGTGSRISTAIGVDKEKENALLEQQSDDECVTTYPAASTSSASTVCGASGSSSNSLLIPAAQRYSTKIHHAGLPRPIVMNRFGMARGRGISQFKHAIDSTKKTQQQIFHRLQSQQPNGTTYAGPFSSAGMIALRNNGSLMRFNSANLTGSSIGSNLSSSVINNGIAIGTAKSAGSTTASEQNAMAKGAARKATSTVTSANGSGGVPVNTDASSTAASSGAGSSNAPMVANQTHYAILRRQPTVKYQSMQILSTRAATSEATNFSVMPVIHRVRARKMTPHVPKNLQAQTDLLLQSLPKSLQAKMLASTLLAMVAKKPVPAPSSSSTSSSSATQSNAIAVSVASASNANPSSSSTSSSSAHNTLKSSATVRPPSKLSHTSSSSFNHKSSLSTSVSSSAALRNVKRNGHYNAAGSSTGGSSDTTVYTVNSLSRNLSNSSGSSTSGVSPSYHRSASNHRSSASLLQMQNSPSIDSLILPKIIS